MAYFRFGDAVRTGGVRMSPALLDGFLDYDNTRAEASTLRFYDDGRNYTQFSGRNFGYLYDGGELAGFSGGTMTTILTRVNGQVTLNITRLSLSLVTLDSTTLATGFAYLLSGNDDILGTDKGDTLVGGAGRDLIFGAKGADNLSGGTGNDLLDGGTYSDVLLGGTGDDTLRGGLGQDVLTGNAGQDAFVFNTSLLDGANRDRITDFVAVDDRIKLDRDIFTQIGPTGTLDADKFQRGVAANSTVDRIIYDKAEGVLMYDRDGKGGVDAVVFATVAPGTVLTHWDIVVF
jgi:Ca2+-binding RTX toxin-like protein